jgi:hypothetical protein
MWTLVVFSLPLLASHPGNIQLQNKTDINACITDVANVIAEGAKDGRILGAICLQGSDASAFVSAADCHNPQKRTLPGGFETLSVDCNGIAAGPK